MITNVGRRSIGSPAQQTVGERVVGVRTQRRGPEHAEQSLDADLVVAACGRAARVPAWLEGLGYASPVEDRLPVDLMYASRRLRLRPGALGGDKLIVIGARPGLPRGLGLLAQEDGQWMLTVMGYGAEHRPPTDEQGHLEFIATVAAPDVLAAIRDAEPLGDVVTHAFPANQRRRYERLKPFAGGLLVIGDAITSFNPLYGQGMSVAALEAVQLRRCLERGEQRLARRFLCAAGKVVDPAWEMAIGGDLALPEVAGHRPVAVRIANAYRLPAEHAACLTSAAGPENIGLLAAYFPMLGSVERELIECFRNGGGVPYSSFPCFHEVMRAESKEVYDATLIETTLPLVPGLPQRLEAGIDVADFGCGSGYAINLMARAYPASRFAGYDFSEEGIDVARAQAAELGLENVRFEVADLAELSERDSFDLVCAFDAIHDQIDPAVVLDRIHAALRPGGTFLMVDFAASSKLEENVDHPVATMIYTFSTMHCMTVSLAHGGAGLGTAWGQQKALAMLAEAGFGEVEVKQVEGDIFNSYYVAAA